MFYDEYRYVILLVYLCCTIGARLLHFWCQGAALLLALLFSFFYMTFVICKALLCI